MPLKTKAAIVKKLPDLCLNPDSTSLDIDTLKGGEGFRLKVGQYRVIYKRDDYYSIIEVVNVRPRGDIYKR